MKKIFYKIAIPVAIPFFRLYWFIFRPNTYGAKVVIICNDEILLIRNSYGHRAWTFPGGGIKRKESAEEAARRETKEEVGITLGKIDFAGSFITTEFYKKDNISVFFARTDNKNIKKCEIEIKEAKWFALSQMPKFTPIAQQIFDMCKSYINK